MPWLIVGTVPDQNFPLTDGVCVLRGGAVEIGGRTVAAKRGTPALLAAFCLAAEVLGIEPPAALLAGDTGRGEGSRLVYERLAASVIERGLSGLTFHYLLPDVLWHDRILFAIEALPKRPLLVADAGYMYAAKMSGQAAAYDLFTPDAGELAFLADETAPHPFYTRGFLLAEERRAPELIRNAEALSNAARHLLVKGDTDYVTTAGGIVAAIEEPVVATLEPIGGTGDSLTGLVSALLAAGRPVVEACILAARANRLMGLIARPTPAFLVADLLPFLPAALTQALAEGPAAKPRPA